MGFGFSGKVVRFQGSRSRAFCEGALDSLNPNSLCRVMFAWPFMRVLGLPLGFGAYIFSISRSGMTTRTFRCFPGVRWRLLTRKGMLGSVRSRACWLGIHVNYKAYHATNGNDYEFNPIPEAVQKSSKHSLLEGASTTVISFMQLQKSRRSCFIYASWFVSFRHIITYLVFEVEALAMQ